VILFQSNVHAYYYDTIARSRAWLILEGDVDYLALIYSSIIYLDIVQGSTPVKKKIKTTPFLFLGIKTTPVNYMYRL